MKNSIIFSIIILMSFFFSTFIPVGNSTQPQTVNIYVAVHNQNDILPSSTGPEFYAAIDGYQWTVGDTTYVFYPTETHMDDVGIEGNLDNYDVFIMAGG